MADQGSTEQLLELLVQLKKTTPKAARDILNAQPAISYALISLMVSMGAINVEVFQKILAQFHESNTRGQAAAQAAPAIPPIITPTPSVSALPPHLQAQYRTGTPPASVPTPPAPAYGYPSQPGYPPPQGYPPPLAGTSAAGYAAYGGQPQPQPQSQPQPQQGYAAYPLSGYTAPPPPAAPPAGRPQSVPTIKPEMLAAFPEEQKALIMHVLSMTQEQLNKLPPEQRNTYLQIRATLGI